MKIQWLILASRLILFIEGLFLILLGLINIQSSFAPARVSIVLGVVSINVAVFLSFLHKNLEKIKIPTQPTFVSSQQVLCTLCGKPNIIKTDFCSICGHKIDT